MSGSLEFDAIGTTWRIRTNIPLSQTIQIAIQNRIALFDQTYSRFRDDSVIAEIARKKGTYGLPSDASFLFALYKTLYRLTQGSFTPLIGQLLVDAGYDAAYSLDPKKLRDIPSWEDVIAYTFPNLTVKKPVVLDFGAAGKGYLTDLVGKVLEKHGILSFSINAGGDILYKTKEEKKLRVGLEHPDDTSKIIGVVELENGSICGSAGNRRKWGAFHHIMDPHKKKSVSTIVAVWVIAKTGLIADGLATALFFVKPEVLAKDFDFAYAILNQEYSLETSPNFPAEFY